MDAAFEFPLFPLEKTRTPNFHLSPPKGRGQRSAEVRLECVVWLEGEEKALGKLGHYVVCSNSLC